MLKICNFMCDHLTKFMVAVALVFGSSCLVEGEMQSYLVSAYQLMVVSAIGAGVFMMSVLFYNVSRISEDPAKDRRF